MGDTPQDGFDHLESAFAEAANAIGLQLDRCKTNAGKLELIDALVDWLIARSANYGNKE